MKKHSFEIKTKHLVFFSLIGLIVSLDQLTKQLIINLFKYGESVAIIPGFFSLTYVRNTGAAFGMLSQWDAAYRIPFFVAVPMIATGVIGFMFRRIDAEDVGRSAVLAAVVGGAIGNLIDRITYEYVIDFLDFYWGQMGPHFPAFNIADMAICIGVFFLIIDTYRHNPDAANKSKNIAKEAN
jgi:signal peptidase II